MPFDTRSSARPLRRRTVPLVILAGLVGEIVLEIIAWGIAPLALGRPMQPAILVAELARALFGAAPPMPLAFGVHLASGIVLFPFAYLLFRSATGMRSPVLAGLLWGVILWLVAQAVLAPLAGRPFMLDQALVVKMFRHDDPGAENAVDARSVLGEDWQRIVEAGPPKTCK